MLMCHWTYNWFNQVCINIFLLMILFWDVGFFAGSCRISPKLWPWQRRRSVLGLRAWSPTRFSGSLVISPAREESRGSRSGPPLRDRFWFISLRTRFNYGVSKPKNVSFFGWLIWTVQSTKIDSAKNIFGNWVGLYVYLLCHSVSNRN